MKIFYLEWCDAYGMPASWQPKDHILDWAKTEEWVVKEVGYLLEENDEYLIFANQVAHEGTEEEVYAGITKIPKTFIRKRVELIIKK